MMKTLELRWTRREGHAQQTFLDFVVSGRSLYAELCRRGNDYISCLGWLADPHDEEARARLLLERRGDLPSGRVSLYICPECGDLGCGAVSVALEPDGEDIIWKEFGHENDYDESFILIERLGPFRFRLADYRQAILSIPKS